MTEIFKPRENMEFDSIDGAWRCRNSERLMVCDGGPSLIRNDGSWMFFWSGKGRHRLDGPASSTGEWFINDYDMSKEVRKFARENGIKLKNLTDEDKILIALKFG